jgi:hypothetical protein
MAQVVVKKIHRVQAAPTQVLKASLSNALQHYQEIFQGWR